MTFTTVFGGTTIAPSNATFLLLPMAADVTLDWPIEQAMSGLVVADTVEVQASSPGLNINLPDARQVSTGYTTLFNNTGANTVAVKDAAGNTLLSLVSGTAWVLYLQDNSTEAGVWRIFQLGASVSVAVAAALAGPGLKAIITQLALDMPISSFNTTPTTLVDADRANFMLWTGGVGALNLPDPVVVGNGWFVWVRNGGSGDLTVTPAAGTIDGAASKTFAAGTSATVLTDGINYYTLGFGSGASGGGSGFDFVEISVAGSGTFALAGANLNRVAYRFIGILTGTRTIEVPGAIQQYWIDNSTTGAFSLFVKTATQAAPGIEVLQNNRAILYCDGNNVLDADSSSVTFPIPVAQGGTGAVNATSARVNLGGTATGIALFTAVDAAAGRTAIAAVPTTRAITAGTGLTGGGDLSADRAFALSRPPLIAYKPADTDRTFIGIVADPDLSVPVEANSVYAVEMYFEEGCVTTNTQSFQGQILVPAGSTFTAMKASRESSGSDSSSNIRLTTFNQNSGSAIPTTIVAMVTGQLRTAGTAGDFALGWCQVSVTGNATRLYAGSWIRLQKLS